MGFNLRGLLFVLFVPQPGLLFEGGFYLETGLIFEDLRYMLNGILYGNNVYSYQDITGWNAFYCCRY
jgi:hypothetical protein